MKKPNCTLGYGCGNTCIDSDLNCTENLSPETSGFMDRMVGAIKKVMPSKETLLHEGEHLARNVSSWYVGKALSPPLIALATSHGMDPDTAKLAAETALQAVAATAMSMRQAKNRSPEKVAGTLFTEAAAALVGKMTHSGTENLATQLAANERAVQISALLAGKFSGITTAIASEKTGAEGRAGKFVADRVKTIGDTFKGGEEEMFKAEPAFIGAVMDWQLMASLRKQRKL